MQIEHKETLLYRQLRRFYRPVGVSLILIALSACSAKYHRKAADNETYKILQAYDQKVFGHTNEFTIDTPYSNRDPKSILPNEIVDSRSTTNQRIINLDQALDLAVKYSREYQTQKEQLYLSALGLTGARYEFTPVFDAGSSAKIEGSPSGSDTGSARSFVNVSQLFKTGGSLTMSLGNDLFRYFSGKPANSARNSAINTLSVDLSQPLLRGFGANDPTIETLTQTERDVVYAVRSFSLYQQQFSIDIVSSYFNLLTQKDIVRNYYRNFTNRVETTRYLEARAVDRERKSSVDDARTAELGAKRDYINSLASFLSSLDTFKTTLGLPISERLYLDDHDLADLTAAGLTPVDIDNKFAFSMCVSNQMEILNSIDRFEDGKRKIRIAADQLRTSLNLVGNATLSSADPYDYTNFDPNKVRYSVGLNLNLPLDRLRERNNYRATLVSFESKLRQLSSTLDAYKVRIDRGIRTLEQTRLNYLNGIESLSVAKRRVENNSMLLEAGRATVRDVRESQDGLVQAENNLATIYASYLSTRLGLLIAIGALDTQPDKFWLMDPLKDRLNPEQRSAPALRMPDDKVLPPEIFIDPAS